jgi:hypothetical protein
MNPTMRIFAGIAGAVLGYVAVTYFFQAGRDSVHFDQGLAQVAGEINKTLPMMVDSATRLDTVIPGPGEKLTYCYTLVNEEKESVDVAALEKALRPQAISGYKTSTQMKSFREHNVELNYQYKDKKGNFIFELAITPKDF